MDAPTLYIRDYDGVEGDYGPASDRDILAQACVGEHVAEHQRAFTAGVGLLYAKIDTLTAERDAALARAEGKGGTPDVVAWIVELEPGVYLATWKGDPGRTCVKSCAKVFRSQGTIDLAIRKARTYRPFPKARALALATGAA